MLSLEFKLAWGETGVKIVLKIERYAQRLTQGYMGDGGSGWWAPDANTQSGETSKTSGEARGTFSVVSLPGSSRFWRSLTRLSRFPSALKLLKNRQATQAKVFNT